ncbi:hypothetical protein RE9431_32820 [Prescottella equi]|uniref:Uncharacterized protein n=1 Tax=Prescottella equi ATCC 33707 TaxID=525370 RepID=E9T3N6_RHOHA|nr:hypothetical protein HMPREF0724_13277 [Prescottella equi ATCC 33707]NKR46941.1 hypothetical protein [Prescottella equi]BCN54966.1 hypothetical protein RE9425_33560 [Prescottella equi]BCN59916.1 hypothetical protein RE9427_32860 [Prescottella equi]BCN64827.1 hypothetical protein RE9431_32820 [Prescottella equi]
MADSSDGVVTLVDKFVGAFRAFVMHAYGRGIPVHGLHKVATLPGGKIDRRKKCLCWCTRANARIRREGSVLRRWTPGKRTSSTRNHTGLRRSRGCRGDHPAGYRPTHSDVPVANV